jgi:hypothetical protein
MRPFSPDGFWSFATSFFSFLDDKSRDIAENFWSGLWTASESLIEQGERLNASESVVNSQTNVFNRFYEVKVSVFTAKPLNLDPTIKQPNFLIVPKSVLYRQPEYDANNIAIHKDLVEISRNEYRSIRSIMSWKGSEDDERLYMVVIPSKSGIVPRYFVVNNGVSSEEDPSSQNYWLPANERTSSYRYFVECQDIDMTFVGDDKFSIYFTTGRAYSVHQSIIDLPTLSSTIGYYDNGETISIGFTMRRDFEYTFSNGLIEFSLDPFVSGIKQDSTLYCENAVAEEDMLYSMYGSLVGIPNRFDLSYRENVTPKAAIGGLVDAYQNPSDIVMYERALNINNALAIAPDNAVVQGVYESFEYKVVETDATSVRLLLTETRELHPFIVANTKVLVNGIRELTITQVDNDRSTGVIALGPDHGVVVDDLLNLELPGAYNIFSILRDLNEPGDGFIEIYAEEEAGRIQFLIDTYQLLTGELPELTVYGTSGFKIERNGQEFVHDGIYHMTGVQKILLANGKSGLRISLYNPYGEDEPRYNDYVVATTEGLNRGFVHFNWPTHKFVLLKSGSEYYRAMIDAPIDTMEKVGNAVAKYQPLCSCVLVANNSIMPAWNELIEFKTNSGIDLESGILELTSFDPGGSFGQYFPSEYQDLKD